ncbi:high-affinity nickel-transporter protein [Halorientalis salina]|uniref:high-affinity nickel-transporter protein n=1 Tax=Halorientalis salina TaxID=2932266 RepID=UPI0010AC373A|nr:high-affinity nickel-transporter protein [Halorientalis salina]
MALTSALVTGAALGVRHSLEADHLAAIATLVDDESAAHPGIVGTSWGIGHTIPIFAIGLLFAVLGVSLPEPVTLAAELLAGLILVVLGARMLVAATGRLPVRSHAHGGMVHKHLHLRGISVGAFHTHIDDESFLVGIVHGLAGSGAVVVTLVATASTVTASLFLLGAFSLVTVVTMGLLSYLWGNVLTTRAQRGLQTVAGLGTVAVGLHLASTTAFGVALLPL